MTNEQINCTKLEINKSSLEVFEHFANEKYAVLLDSGNSQHINSRFDIISFNPIHTLEAISGKVLLDGKECDESFFATMKIQLQYFHSAAIDKELPFTGGWLGYFGYDLGRYIESLPAIAEQDIAIPDASIGLYPDALIYDNQKSCWYFVSQPGYQRLSDYMVKLTSASPNYDTFTLASPWQSNMTSQQYSDKFSQIQRYLRSGDCYQINLAQRFSAAYSGHPWCAYKRLTKANSAPFSAFINLQEDALISVSPERFIEVNNGKVETKPIKGTLPRLENKLADQQQAGTLKNSSKDRAENVMIVDLLRNDLGKVAQPGSVSVPKLFDIESFPSVHHLVSTVTSTLAEGKTAIDQLEAAFPGGSITGAPKIRAMEIIEELEPHRRSGYCGSIGYVSACGRMDTSITIRTLVCHEGKIHCWAGGGIVADSQVDLEYQETFHKVNKILPILS
ncbi:aminodeoxychorismate synthase component I [Pseudoalteromonas sp. T1lg65]|uniref:aminodeoxychorismate synthase component I n=1 Tax=Pseudoalteromonas sp. T1lg65 TaxID=2077101 RepID=UPI003F79D95D